MNLKKIAYANCLSILILNLLLSSTVLAHDPSIDAASGISKEAPKEPAIEDPVRFGATVYNTCYYCHSLKPNVHLTGPSLAGLWGKKAGQVKEYELYSDGLKKSGLTWNKKTLQDWLRDPQKLVPGTPMPFPRIDEERIVALVEFLKIAMAKDGYEKVIKDKLVSEKIAIGQIPKFMRVADKTSIVKAIESCGQTYSILLADDSKMKAWKFNIGFKVLHGELGVKENEPILSPIGSMGDRFEITFHSIKELTALVTECKSK